MLPDPIIINDKSFQPQRRLKWGEVEAIRGNVSRAMVFADKFKGKKIEELSQQDMDELFKFSAASQDVELQMMAEILKNCMGWTQEQLEELEYSEALEIYQNLYTQSIQIKKKSNPQYA